MTSTEELFLAIPDEEYAEIKEKLAQHKRTYLREVTDKPRRVYSSKGRIIEIATGYIIVPKSAMPKEVEAEKVSDEPLPLPEPVKCQLCAKPTVSCCNRCKKMWYCSRECQVADWSKHKPNCKAE